MIMLADRNFGAGARPGRMAEATRTRRGRDPDRASFTIALDAAMNLNYSALALAAVLLARCERDPAAGQDHRDLTLG
jgi:hypothetical protein